MWPEVMQRLQVYDPGNQYGVNYMWGTTGIGLNMQKVRQRLGNQALNTWDLMLRWEVISKLKDCGVQILDAPEDIFPNVLNWLGLNPDSKRLDDLNRAGEQLFRIRGAVQKFHSSEYINALANGDICMAVGYSGDVLQAKKRAEEAKNGVEIGYVIPREGALMWFDSIAIPADAKNVNEAHAFIDYLMRPEVAAQNTNFVAYASGNLAAKQFVNPEILNNPGVYPDEATFKRLFTNTAYDERSQRIVTRAWTQGEDGAARFTAPVKRERSSRRKATGRGPMPDLPSPQPSPASGRGGTPSLPLAALADQPLEIRRRAVELGRLARLHGTLGAAPIGRARLLQRLDVAAPGGALLLGLRAAHLERAVAPRDAGVGHEQVALAQLVAGRGKRRAGEDQRRCRDEAKKKAHPKFSSRKKSLPLSSMTMKAGKFSTSIRQIASMPSSGYSTTSTLRMQSCARRAAGPPIEPR